MFVQDGSGDLVDIQESSFCGIEDLTVAYNSQTFNGTAVNMSLPSVKAYMRNVTVYQFGEKSNTASALLKLDGAVGSYFENCYFGGGGLLRLWLRPTW